MVLAIIPAAALYVGRFSKISEVKSHISTQLRASKPVFLVTSQLDFMPSSSEPTDRLHFNQGVGKGFV